MSQEKGGEGVVRDGRDGWYDLDGGEDGSDGSERERVQECVSMCEMVLQLVWWP